MAVIRILTKSDLRSQLTLDLTHTHSSLLKGMMKCSVVLLLRLELQHFVKFK